LHYHPEWPLPPTVGLGLERDRQQWINTIDDVETLRLTVWNPAQFSDYRDGSVHWDLIEIDAELARAGPRDPGERGGRRRTRTSDAQPRVPRVRLARDDR
jgi:hypothetical protein